MSNLRQTVKSKPVGITIVFHWSYVYIPIAFLLLSLILVAFFYQRLPGDVAYQFQSDGSPDRWLKRGTIVLWLLVPQLFLTLLAGAFTLGITKLVTLLKPTESAQVKTEKIIRLMGNMVALPQALLFFAMLDIFSYNAYQIHILPLWAMATIIVVVGGLILVLFFRQAIRDVRGTSR
ncbi:MAG: hypothetical protein HW402_1090 [Dehalococcoidales bacterium]|nr:hypothetical protein [Dehalococcoidales bacterium]